jgi:hypothetical protein
MSTVESGSKPLLIEDSTLRNCSSLSSNSFPSSLSTLAHFAASGASLDDISIEGGNLHVKVRGDFLMDSDCVSIVHYFGRGTTATIGCSDTLQSVTFESSSNLSCIEAFDFWCCPSLSSIGVRPSKRMAGFASLIANVFRV